MKNKLLKRSLSLLLSIILVMGSVVSTYAETSTTSEDIAAQSVTILDNIAAGYAVNGPGHDGNSAWIVADMSAYATVYPDNTYQLSSDEKRLFVNSSISQVSSTTDAAILAKSIISLKSLGYDASNLIASDGSEVNAVAKLKTWLNADSIGSISIYTLPYVLIALQQDTNYAAQEEIDLIINVILNQAYWQAAVGDILMTDTIMSIVTRSRLF
jgi:uncharacterized protein YlzI (FlbEa/FlbD family)